MVEEKPNNQQETIVEEPLVGQPRYMGRSDGGVHDCPELFYADIVPSLSQMTRTRGAASSSREYNQTSDDERRERLSAYS